MSLHEHNKNINNNPYGANGMNTHIITPKGRGNFVGVIDLETGRIRIDSKDDPSFWMTIDLSQYNFSQYSPGGIAEENIKKSFNEKIKTSVLKGSNKGSLDSDDSDDDSDSE